VSAYLECSIPLPDRFAVHHYMAMEALGYIAFLLLVSILIASALHMLGNTPRNHANFVLMALRILIVTTVMKFLGLLGEVAGQDIVRAQFEALASS
jgi:hypothetical protein